MAYNVKFLKGTDVAYQALVTAGTVNADTFYYVDGKHLYLGTIELSNETIKTDLGNAVARIATNEDDIADLKESLAALIGEDTGSIGDLIDAAVKAEKERAEAAEKAAQDAADAAQSDVDALEELVGAIPEDAKAKTVVDYAEEVAQAKADEVQDNLDDLEERVAANEAAITTITGEGEGSIKKAAADATASAIAQLISDSEDDKIDEKFDTLKEIADWILDSEDNAAGLDAATRLAALEETVNGVSDEDRGLVGKVGTLESEYSSLNDALGEVQQDIIDINAAIGTVPEDSTVMAEIGKAKDAADAAQSDVDDLEELVGTIPTDSEAETVIGYVDEQVAAAITAATYDDTEVRGLISDNADAIDAINDAETGIAAVAAADATKKAGDALTSAKGYTDEQIGALAEVYEPIGAEERANGYTDDEIEALAEVYEPIGAENRAKAYTDTALTWGTI